MDVINPTYTLYYQNVQAILADLNIKCHKSGWYRKGDDYVLIVPDSTEDRPNQLCVSIWNNQDPRPFWRKALALPEFKLEGGDVLNV